MDSVRARQVPWNYRLPREPTMTDTARFELHAAIYGELGARRRAAVETITAALRETYMIPIDDLEAAAEALTSRLPVARPEAQQ